MRENGEQVRADADADADADVDTGGRPEKPWPGGIQGSGVGQYNASCTPTLKIGAN